MVITEQSFPPLHGFFGRRGGVSKGVYDSLNCSPFTDDDLSAVRENRALVTGEFQINQEKLLTLQQVHGDNCHVVTELWRPENSPKADALVTDRPGLLLGVLTADCAPVLFYGETAGKKPVVGVAHAGWKGALGGILESAIAGLELLGAGKETLRAVIGPCIGPQSYEVSHDFAEKFLKQNPENENDHFFQTTNHEGHMMFDLPGYVAGRLAAGGVRRVAIKGVDTCFNEMDYFSARRSHHRAEPDFGRQVSVVGIS